MFFMAMGVFVLAAIFGIKACEEMDRLHKEATNKWGLVKRYDLSPRFYELTATCFGLLVVSYCLAMLSFLR